MYPLKLKGISICFSMLKDALCGSYVNFGVFRPYGDEALDNALNTFVTLLLSIPQTDLLDYPKLSQTYYVLLECLAQDHMAFLATLEQTSLFSLGESISSPEHQRLAASFRRNEPPLVASADWTCGLLACGS